MGKFPWEPAAMMIFSTHKHFSLFGFRVKFQDALYIFEVTLCKLFQSHLKSKYPSFYMSSVELKVEAHDSAGVDVVGPRRVDLWFKLHPGMII